MDIPKQLQRPEIRFNLIKEKEKAAFEKKWNTEKNYAFDDQTLLIHLQNGGNYGVLSGIGDLIIVDVDKPELIKNIKLPRTFTVKTSAGFHLYYKIRTLKKKIILEDNTDTHVGEIQAEGQYVVGPNAIHPTGAVYSVVDESEIKEIQPEEILEPLQGFIPIKSQQEYEIDTLPITNIAMPLNYKQTADGCYQGAHPFHESQTGTNFKIDAKKNLWCCFHHNTGGTASYLIAVKEGILKCSECKPGALRGEGFKNVLKIAEEKYNIKKQNMRGAEDWKNENYNPSEDAADLLAKDYEEPEWLVTSLIPAVGISFIGGKRSSFKSWIALDLALAVAINRQFLTRYETKQGNVLYINTENSSATLTKRLKMLKHTINSENMKDKLKFLNYTGFKFDDQVKQKWLEAFIIKNNIKLIICDPFGGTHTKDENSATEVRGIFTDIIGRVSKEYGVAFVLIHHLRKSGPQTTASDLMDEFRGSSEFVNYASSVLLVNRNTVNKNQFELHHIKSRDGEETESGVFEAFADEEKNFFFSYLCEREVLTLSAEKCLQKILEWAKTRGIFSTKGVGEEFAGSFSKRTIYDSLKLGVKENLLKKPSRGKYQVLVKDEGQKTLLSAQSAESAEHNLHSGNNPNPKEEVGEPNQVTAPQSSSSGCVQKLLVHEVQDLYIPCTSCTSKNLTKKGFLHEKNRQIVKILDVLPQKMQKSLSTISLETGLSEKDVFSLLTELAKNNEVLERSKGEWVRRGEVIVGGE